jgi:TonB family protein
MLFGQYGARKVAQGAGETQGRTNDRVTNEASRATAPTMQVFRPAFAICAVFSVYTTTAALSFAQNATAAAVLPTPTTPPVLDPLSESAAEYPETELKRSREATVGLTLNISAQGDVTHADVSSSAGAAFDAAALRVVRNYRFAPARQNGTAVACSVQFNYEFHLPVAASPAAAARQAAEVPREPEPVQTGADQSTLVLSQRPLSAASSASVRDRDFQLRPIGSVADILRVTPGLLVVQHAGGGKANQYFLRGFDADHGTDIAFSLDGIPINMVSHGHGQGYTDTNFIIPETIERIELSKGPYFAEQGNFATAGAVNLITRKNFEHSAFGFSAGGSPGYGAPGYRGLLIASPKLAQAPTLHPYFAAEIGRNNGPFETAERFDRYKFYSKLTWDFAAQSQLTFGASSYAGDWFGSGQVAQRAVTAGTLNRFGTHDPTEGGGSARHQAFVAIKLRPSETSEFQASAYIAQYRLNLYSNFTLFRDDEASGDGILQRDRRTFFGGKSSYRTVAQLAGIRFDTALGANVRSDNIDNQLDRQAQRQLAGALGDSRISETSFGLYVKEEATVAKWLRIAAGGRADLATFAVDDQLDTAGNANSGSTGVQRATQFSPKFSVVTTPFSGRRAALDLYLNYGHGFHSNDARGVVRGQGGATPLTRAVGSEFGARAKLFGRLDVALAFWQLDLASETVWIGDEGTTEPGAQTRRIGAELETRLAITPWLSADLDLTATKSQLRANAGNGNSVALAPRRTWSGGISARHPSGLRAGIRFYGVSDRPATQDYPAPGSLVADGFTVVDLHAGYRHRRFDVALDVENLFNSVYKSAQFATTSRLRTEPSTSGIAPAGTCKNGSRQVTQDNGNFGGCEDVNFTPGYPFTLRLMTTLYLD